MRAHVAVVLLAAAAITSSAPAWAIPDCPPGMHVVPSVDGKGNPQPGGDCAPDVPTTASASSSAVGNADVAPPPSTSTKATDASSTKSPPATGCRGCAVATSGAEAPTLVIVFGTIAFAAIRRRKRGT